MSVLRGKKYSKVGKSMVWPWYCLFQHGLPVKILIRWLNLYAHYSKISLVLFANWQNRDKQAEVQCKIASLCPLGNLAMTILIICPCMPFSWEHSLIDNGQRKQSCDWVIRACSSKWGLWAYCQHISTLAYTKLTLKNAALLSISKYAKSVLTVVEMYTPG